MLCKETLLSDTEFCIQRKIQPHLLNVCRSFDVEPNKVKLHINGMIDEGRICTQPFTNTLHIEFDKLPGNYTYAEEIKAHPAHFFSHLFALASCV